MNPAPLALLVYSAQILLVVSVATLAVVVSRVPGPTLRLAYWRAVGVVCVALPLLAPEPVERSAISVSFVTAAMAQDAAVVIEPASQMGAMVLWIWAGGAFARLVWLMAGAWRLRQLRRHSAPALLEDQVEALRLSLAPRAEFRWSPAVAQPVTFGIRRPVILLPPRFGELSVEAQCAAACHELLHVTRKDWMWIVLEEHVRALFWFHPAVWWLVEQVQLAREQVIDRLVVSRDISKRTYMAALLAFADRHGTASLSIALLRRRHLKSRFRQLSKESHMSFRYLAWTTAVLAVVMGGAALGAARALPLDLPTLSLQGRPGAQLEIRLAESTPGPGLREAVVSGSDRRVYLHRATLATDGDVTNARVIDLGGHFGVGLQFSGTASARMSSGTAAHLGRPVAIVLDGSVVSAPTLKSPIGDSAVISGLTAAAAQDLAAKLAPVRPTQNGAIRDGVTLPVPIHEERPQYTPAAMQAKVEGSVLLEAVVLTDGSVGDVTVVQSLDSQYGLDQQAVDAMKLWTFQPGTRDGGPVRVAVQVQMTFTLK